MSAITLDGLFQRALNAMSDVSSGGGVKTQEQLGKDGVILQSETLTFYGKFSTHQLHSLTHEHSH